jgi:hypothetical protein
MSARVLNTGISEEGWVMNTVDLAEMWRQRGEFLKAEELLQEAFEKAQRKPEHDRYGYVLLHRARLRASMAEAE